MSDQSGRGRERERASATASATENASDTDSQQKDALQPHQLEHSEEGRREQILSAVMDSNQMAALEAYERRLPAVRDAVQAGKIFPATFETPGSEVRNHDSLPTATYARGETVRKNIDERGGIQQMQGRNRAKAESTHKTTF